MPKRYAAGRARVLGLATHGTTAPRRLRRVDDWLVAVHGELLTAAPDPLVVDLGFGDSAVTTVELHARLRALRQDVTVVGLENDPARVAAAGDAQADGLSFATGGFELAGRRPTVVRAMNVLRQYDHAAASAAWLAMQNALAPGGLLVEGSCDEAGTRAAWVTLDRDGPRTLTLAADVATLTRPCELAAQLPRSLIEQHAPGHPVHDLLVSLDQAWERAATGKPAQRWVTACATSGWPLCGPIRHHHGELTVPWESVSG